LILCSLKAVDVIFTNKGYSIAINPFQKVVK
jgi:hypothetical protein